MSDRPPPPPAEDDRGATVTFLRQWLREPRAIAAIAPSSRELARRMAAAVGKRARAVVELGAGTGTITRALLEGGIPAPGLLVVERNPELHAVLTERFPAVAVVLGDALELERVLAAARPQAIGRLEAVVSGLGLLTLSRADQRRLLEQAFRVLAPRGRFVQFSYAPLFPVPREVLAELGLVARRVAFSLRNLPPAAIYVVTRRRAAARP